MIAIPAQEIHWHWPSVCVRQGREVIVIYADTIFSAHCNKPHYEAFYDQFDLWPGVDTWETQFRGG
jgi:hypothetical protein